MPAPTGQPERLRRDAGPRRREFPVRAHRRKRARRPSLPARHAGDRDHLAHAHRLADRARRAVHRAVVPRAAPLGHPPAPAHRLRGGAHPPAHREVRGRERGAEPRLPAGVRLRANRRHVGVLEPGLRRGDRHGRPERHPAAAGHRPARRLRRSWRARDDDPAPGRDGPMSRSPGRARNTRRPRSSGPSTRRRRPPTRRSSASSAPRTTGASGSTTASFPSTRGRATCSAARSRSRASPTARPAPCSPRRPRRCPRRSAASATGTTGTRGSATGPSCCGASTRSASTARPTTSSTSSPTWRRSRQDLQIMYGIGGEPELTEATLDHLSGYEGSTPVRIGNAAYAQRQHDVWGAVLDSVYLHTKSRDYMPEVVWPILKRAVESRDRQLEEARPRHLGGSRRAAALHIVEADVLGRVRSRRAPRGAARRPRPGRSLAGGRGRDQVGHLPPRRRQARRVRAALRHRRRSTPRCS